MHCAKASDVQTVMVDGELLMRDRQLTRHDEKKVLADARQANRDLMERVSGLSLNEEAGGNLAVCARNDSEKYFPRFGRRQPRTSIIAVPSAGLMEGTVI